MRSSARLAAAGFVFVAACGARSTLRDPTGSPPGSGGTGGGTGTVTATTSTSATAGPGGGPSGVCAALVSHDPPIELPGSSLALSARDPLLELFGNGDVLALARRDAPNSPAVGSVHITATRFDPWSGWPPALDPSLDVTPSAPAFAFVSSRLPPSRWASGLSPPTRRSGASSRRATVSPPAGRSAPTRSAPMRTAPAPTFPSASRPRETALTSSRAISSSASPHGGARSSRHDRPRPRSAARSPWDQWLAFWRAAP